MNDHIEVMDPEEFRRCAKQMVDYVADYWANLRQRSPLPTVQPGYMRQLIPDHAPEQAESWSDVMNDLESVVMQGVRHTPD